MKRKQKVPKPLHGEHITIPFIHELMKGKSEVEIREAEDTYLRYLSLVRKIHNRLEREEMEQAGEEYIPEFDDMPPFPWERE